MLDVHFARSGDVDVAYHVVGDGPIDLVYVQGSYTHLQVFWELPPFRRFCERLAEFSRVILFDKRGMGMSTRVPGATPLDIRMDDVTAVMDDVGSEQATLLGNSEGGPLSMLAAAARPDRVSHLILMGAEVRERKDEAWPWGEVTEEEFEEIMSLLPERWGRPSRGYLERFAPSLDVTPWLADWTARLQANACTPGGIEAFMRMAFDIDVRDIVASIRVPTLILHSVDDRICHVENGRFLAREIPHARLVELEDADHLPWFHPDVVLSEIQEFLTGHRVSKTWDRVLATVLFTDVVESSDTAASLGDRRWREMLEAHNDLVRSELVRFRGREVNTTGDGFLATFDGPARAIHCAQAIERGADNLNIGVRAGVHTGEVERIGEDIAGITVHIASRIAALAGRGEVLVSSTVRDLVAGSGLQFEDRGRHVLKGIPGEWQLLAAMA